MVEHGVTVPRRNAARIAKTRPRAETRPRTEAKPRARPIAGVRARANAVVADPNDTGEPSIGDGTNVLPMRDVAPAVHPLLRHRDGDDLAQQGGADEDCQMGDSRVSEDQAKKDQADADRADEERANGGQSEREQARGEQAVGEQADQDRADEDMVDGMGAEEAEDTSSDEITVAMPSWLQQFVADEDSDFEPLADTEQTEPDARHGSTDTIGAAAVEGSTLADIGPQSQLANDAVVDTDAERTILLGLCSSSEEPSSSAVLAMPVSKPSVAVGGASSMAHHTIVARLAGLNMDVNPPGSEWACLQDEHIASDDGSEEGAHDHVPHGDAGMLVLTVPPWNGWGLTSPVLSPANTDNWVRSNFPPLGSQVYAMLQGCTITGPCASMEYGGQSMEKIVRDVVNYTGLEGVYDSNVGCGSWIKYSADEGSVSLGDGMRFVRITPREGYRSDANGQCGGFIVYSPRVQGRSIEDWIDEAAEARFRREELEMEYLNSDDF